MNREIIELAILIAVLGLVFVALLAYKRLGLYLAKAVGRMGGTSSSVRTTNKLLKQVLTDTKEIKMAQDDLNQQVADLNTSLDTINSGVTDLKTHVTSVETELAAVKEQLANSDGTSDVDLSGLEAAVAKAKTTADQFQTIPPVEVPTEPSA